MFVEFDQLSATSKIWIYQANRELSNDEVVLATSKLSDFIKNWQSHGKDLIASFQIKYNQFIVISVDVAKTNYSGCSVDASVALIKEIEKELQIDLFDRLKITFKSNENVNTVNLANFKKYIAEGKIDKNTVVFNNLVKTIAEFQEKWEIPAKDSWHIRMF